MLNGFIYEKESEAFSFRVGLDRGVVKLTKNYLRVKDDCSHSKIKWRKKMENEYVSLGIWIQWIEAALVRNLRFGISKSYIH